MLTTKILDEPKFMFKKCKKGTKKGLRGAKSLFCSSGALEATRTPDPQLRRLLLYPAELRGHEHYNNVILQFYQFNF